MNLQPDTPKRDSRLDVARGAAIIAIVLVHVVRGLHAAGQVDAAAEDMTARAVGMWCMSVFAFVGGTFVPRSVQKLGVRDYVSDRVLRFLALYVIWMLLQGAAHLVASGAANRTTSVGRIFQFWRPDGQLWYLPFLILVTLVFVPMQPWLPRRARLILVAAAALSLICWGFDGGLVGKQGPGLAVFFVAGLVIGTAKVQAALDRVSVPSATVISVAALAACGYLAVLTTAIPPTYFWFDATPARIAVGVVLTLVSSVAILLFGQAARSASVLALCGRRSLDIFLAHIILSSGARVVLLKLGIENIWVIIAVCIFVGVAGSLAVGIVLRRMGLGWVVDGPNVLAGLRQTGAATQRWLGRSSQPDRS